MSEYANILEVSDAQNPKDTAAAITTAETDGVSPQAPDIEPAPSTMDTSPLSTCVEGEKEESMDYEPTGEGGVAVGESAREKVQAESDLECAMDIGDPSIAGGSSDVAEAEPIQAATSSEGVMSPVEAMNVDNLTSPVGSVEAVPQVASEEESKLPPPSANKVSRVEPDSEETQSAVACDPSEPSLVVPPLTPPGALPVSVCAPPTTNRSLPVMSPEPHPIEAPLADTKPLSSVTPPPTVALITRDPPIVGSPSPVDLTEACVKDTLEAQDTGAEFSGDGCVASTDPSCVSPEQDVSSDSVTAIAVPEKNSRSDSTPEKSPLAEESPAGVDTTKDGVGANLTSTATPPRDQDATERSCDSEEVTHTAPGLRSNNGSTSEDSLHSEPVQSGNEPSDPELSDPTSVADEDSLHQEGPYSEPGDEPSDSELSDHVGMSGDKEGPMGLDMSLVQTDGDGGGVVVDHVMEATVCTAEVRDDVLREQVAIAEEREEKVGVVISESGDGVRSIHASKADEVGGVETNETKDSVCESSPPRDETSSPPAVMLSMDTPTECVGSGVGVALPPRSEEQPVCASDTVEELVTTCEISQQTPEGVKSSTSSVQSSDPALLSPCPAQDVVITELPRPVATGAISIVGGGSSNTTSLGMPAFTTVARTFLTAATPVIATPSTLPRQPQPKKLSAGLSPALSSNLAALFPYANKFASTSRSVSMPQAPALPLGTHVLITSATPTSTSSYRPARSVSAATKGPVAGANVQSVVLVAPTTPSSVSDTAVSSGDLTSQPNAVSVIAHVPPVLKGAEKLSSASISQVLREQERIVSMPASSKMKVDKAELLHPPSEIQHIGPKDGAAASSSAAVVSGAAKPQQVFTVDLSQFTIPKVMGMQTVPPVQKFGGLKVSGGGHKLKEEAVAIVRMLNTSNDAGGVTAGSAGSGAQQPLGM